MDDMPDWERELLMAKDPQEPPTGGIEFHQVTPGRDKLHRALASAVNWLVAVTVVTAIPVNVWLWGWAT